MEILKGFQRILRTRNRQEQRFHEVSACGVFQRVYNGRLAARVPGTDIE